MTSCNSINDFNSLTFEEKSVLKTLDLTNCNEKIDFTLFKDLTRLENLILRGCNLCHLPSEPFDELVNLTRLDLSDNIIPILHPNIFNCIS